MGEQLFTKKEFYNRVFDSKPFDKTFLKKWNNTFCIKFYCALLWTPVEWAARHGYLDVIKFLVENGADITLDDNYAIRVAIQYYCIDIIKYLLSTNIYTEEYIRMCINFTSDFDLEDLLVNYKQFPRTKACR